MYKTIRQGENSLQYTILPQQDEGRSGPVVVGHRNNGGNPRQSAGSRKKSILAYIGLFFVCAIITFAILIPLMVTTDLMPTPSAWFYRNQKVRDFRSPVNVKLSVDARQESHIIKGTPLRTTLTMTTTATPMTTSTTTATSTTTETSVTRPAEHTDLLTVTEFQNLYKSDESMEQSGMNRMDLLQEEFIAPTTTTTAVNLFLSRARQRMTTTTTTGTLTSTIRPSSTPQLLQRNYPKHFSLQKHEKAATTFDIVQQAPQAPPPQPDSRTIRVVTNDDEMSTVHQNWLQSHWSYVDPYLQWRNYAADDRVVLPLILGVSLATVVVIILMCYLVKRKRMCRLCKKSANNRHVFENVEAQEGEDHENLLTNEIQSEEEEE